MASKTSTAAHQRVLATFRKDKGSAVSDLALLDDARTIGGDDILSMTTADRVADIPKDLKGEDLKKAKKRAEKTAQDWTRQLMTAVELFDLVVDGRAKIDDKKAAASAILKRARRGSNDVAAKGCTIKGSGNDLVTAVQEAIKGKNGKPSKAKKDEALSDMAKVVTKRTKSDNDEGPLLRAARTKVEAMRAALIEGDSGNAEKAAKVAAQIEEAAAYLAKVREEAKEIMGRVDKEAAEAAAQADAQEIEDAA